MRECVATPPIALVVSIQNSAEKSIEIPGLRRRAEMGFTDCHKVRPVGQDFAVVQGMDGLCGRAVYMLSADYVGFVFIEVFKPPLVEEEPEEDKDDGNQTQKRN